jgi:hypothetical protein
MGEVVWGSLMLPGSRSTVKTRLCPSCLPEFELHFDHLSSLYARCVAAIHYILRQGPRQVYKYPTCCARSLTHSSFLSLAPNNTAGETVPFPRPDHSDISFPILLGT